MRVQLYAVCGIAYLAAAAGCSANNGSEDGGASTGATGSTGSSGLGASTSGSGSRLRLANLVPAGPSFDLCIAIHGSGQFQGPLLASLGFTSGVGYTDVSTYLAVPALALDFRLVAPGTDCSQPLNGSTDLTDLPPLAAGAAYTVAQIVKATPPTQIFEDDLLTNAAGTASLRFLDTSSADPTLDLGSVQDGGFNPWITGVQFLGVGGTAQGFSLDANGYLAIPATPDVLLRVEYQSADLLDLRPQPGAAVALSDGSLYTLFTLPGTPLGGLFCDDQALKQSGYAACVAYPIPGVGSSGTTSGGNSTTGSAATSGSGSGSGVGTGSSSGGSGSGSGTGSGSTTGSGPSTDGGLPDGGPDDGGLPG